ncbi:RNA polymerase sigma-70 factor [Niabella yanshanensis]|uniref:RNA polymerase sigma-70 factor n=1 Tax=Niabella yanshanensis TaxID=577386 RepID=A0ABZ0W757_9BACT|nr:RNA polymerase sigma-70 factor [Niabella yanshanensis]WQD37901.1 RNA polymerase sigma-70 factor [Niabella yanshanensis]
MNEDRKRYLLLLIAEHDDQKGFDELFNFYFPGLVSFASNILKDRQLAEEIVEDVFVKLWLNRKTMVSIKSPSHYIYTAVKYASLSALKKHQTISLEDYPDDMGLSYSNPELVYISNENIGHITDAINQLPSRCRLIFRLIKEEGLKYEEVAQLLQLSVKTVESQMTIAIKKLTITIQQMLPDMAEHLLRKKA